MPTPPSRAAFRWLFICIATSLALAGCGLKGGGPPLKQKVYNATLTSFDGTKIAFTVFQPKLAQGQPAPLLLDSPGFGGTRYKSLAKSSSSGYENPTKTAAREAWHHGYFVITYDQRGFGDSGGKAHIEDPDMEGRDVSQLLDWAEAHLRPQLGYRDGNPAVGAIGYSYGGGFQTIGSAVDSRIDAIVPSLTWNNLVYSLDPRGGIKTGWATVLALLGSAEGKLAPFVYKAVAEGLAANGVEQKILHDDFYLHSLQSYCAGAQPSDKGVPQVAAFLIQGSRDSLFDMNEAARNASCLRRAGNPVKVLIQRQGHTLPVIQGQLPNHQIGFAIDQRVTCGNKTFRTADLMFHFLERHLELIPFRQPPAVCIVQNDTHGLTRKRIPRGGVKRSLPGGTTVLAGPPPAATALTLITNNVGYIGNVAEELQPVAPNLAQTLRDGLSSVGTLNPDQLSSGGENVIADLLGVLPPKLLNTLSGPQFVPLYTAQATRALAGLPKARLNLDGVPALKPRIFAGLGVKRAGADAAHLLDAQVTPISGTGDFDLNLNGVSTELQKGDRVGLLLYGFQPQYASSFSRAPSPVTVTGSVSLPVVEY